MCDWSGSPLVLMVCHYLGEVSKCLMSRAGNTESEEQ